MKELIKLKDAKDSAEAVIRYYWARRHGQVARLGDGYLPDVQQVLGVREFERVGHGSGTVQTFPSAPGVTPSEEGWYLLIASQADRLRWEIILPFWWDVLKLQHSEGVAVTHIRRKTPWTQEQIAQWLLGYNRNGQATISRGTERALTRLAFELFKGRIEPRTKVFSETT